MDVLQLSLSEVYSSRKMEHFFELPVTYKGEELNFKSRLVTFGYVYKFHIIVNGRELVFEKDDELNYRVLANDEKTDRSIDDGLIEVIIAALKRIGENERIVAKK